MNYISVIGAGAWGTALANLLGKKGYDVMLWVFERELAKDMEKTRINKAYLPDLEISENIVVTSDLKEALSKARFILLVVPSQYIRNILRESLQYIRSEAIIISASKGIERKTLKTMSFVIKEFTNNNIAVLSGPSFALEVTRKLPTAITLGIEDESVGIMLQEVLNTDYFRVYTHNDILGVELGGALKNVIAIAAGIIDGLELGFNTRAALITRGLIEIIRLGIRLGANEKTFSGLSGLGDLVLTSTSKLSRNYTVGLKIGRGKKLKEILDSTLSIAEGIDTSASAYELAKRSDVEMPIVEQVYTVIHKGKDPKVALQELMTRDLKREF